MIILVRYGELFLKSNYVRRSFTDRLVTNIRNQLRTNKIDYEYVKQINGRIVVETPDERIFNMLEKVFGVVSFSPVIELEKDIKKMQDTAVKLSEAWTGSFAVRAKRADKSFPLKSNQIEMEIGASIAITGRNVDLTEPDNTLYIEVRDKIYMYDKKHLGPGGLPFGTSGRMLTFIHDEKDLKANLMLMKRGIEPLIIDGSAQKIVDKLSEWSPLGLEPKPIDVLEKKHPQAYISPETDIKKLKKKEYNLPVFYPLMGFTKEELSQESGRL